MAEKAQEEKFVDLIQKHKHIIHKVINIYIDDPEDRKDLSQEILLQAWQSFSRFKAQSTFSTWLYRVALNTVFNFQKREKRKVSIGEKPAVPTPSSKGQTDQELLYMEIKRLEILDRALITLHLDGYKNPEIAEMLGLTTNHVSVKIHRIKDRIIQKMKSVIHGSI